MHQNPELIIDFYTAYRDKKRSSLIVKIDHCMRQSSIRWQEARVVKIDDLTSVLLASDGKATLPLPVEVANEEEWRHVMLDVTTPRVACVYLVPMFAIFGVSNEDEFRAILDGIKPMIATTTQASIEPFPVAQAVSSL